MPEHPLIIRLRDARRTRVRYQRANLYVTRWGELASGELGATTLGFEDGERGEEDVCWAFVRSRIESHTASFDFEKAELSRLVGIVAEASTEPEFRDCTIDGVAQALVAAAADERERARELRAQSRQRMKPYIDTSAFGLARSVQASLDRWKLSSIYEPQLPKLSNSLAELSTGVLGGAEPPDFSLTLANTKSPPWARAITATTIAGRLTPTIHASIAEIAAKVSHTHLEGHIAALGAGSLAGSVRAGVGVGVAGGASPNWLGAFAAVEIGVKAAPALRHSLAEVASDFPQLDFRRHYASLGIAAQLGDLQIPTLLKAGSLQGYAGIGELAQRQLGLLPRLPAWKDWADSFERSLPANWRELDSAEVDRAAELMGETGLCLAWVPRAELIRALLAASDHQGRCQILVANANEILGDIEDVLLEVDSEELAPIAGAAEEAIRSARAGAPGPAQSHVASALGHVAHGYFGYESFGPVRERFADVDPVNDVGFAEFSFYAIGRAWVISIASFKQAGDGFNRNLTAHYVGAPHYSQANLLAGLMLLAGLLRELQRQERRLEVRQLQAA